MARPKSANPPPKDPVLTSLTDVDKAKDLTASLISTVQADRRESYRESGSSPREETPEEKKARLDGLPSEGDRYKYGLHLRWTDFLYLDQLKFEERSNRKKQPLYTFVDESIDYLRLSRELKHLADIQGVSCSVLMHALVREYLEATKKGANSAVKKASKKAPRS